MFKIPGNINADRYVAFRDGQTCLVLSEPYLALSFV